MTLFPGWQEDEVYKSAHQRVADATNHQSVVTLCFNQLKYILDADNCYLLNKETGHYFE